MASTSAERLGQFRYMVPTPTPAARAICSIDGSPSGVAKSSRATSNTRCRFRRASARIGRPPSSSTSGCDTCTTSHSSPYGDRFANRNHVPYHSGRRFRLARTLKGPMQDLGIRSTAALADESALDPRRWITLGIMLIAVLIAGLDSTVLNVAIPTILREFHTTLPSLQWVITGYSLTFAALLIIGGRLGDIFGARRMFIIGAALFALGSLIASLSTGVPSLVIGEAIIEGAGASLMLPATMSIMSGTFVGRERATAFAAWGAVLGAAVAFGPLLGGFLTTNYSWRWAFRVNVIVAPLAIVGALLFVRRTPRSARRERIDLPGALLIASGMFMLVFWISEGTTYGWWTVEKPLNIIG